MNGIRNLKKILSKSVYSAETNYIIPFHDVDMFEIVWYGNFIKYLEIGREKLANALNINFYNFKKNNITAPVVELNICYNSPVKYADEITIIGHFIPLHKMILRMGFEIYNINRELIAIAVTDQAFLMNNCLILIYDEFMDNFIPENLREYFGK